MIISKEVARKQLSTPEETLKKELGIKSFSGSVSAVRADAFGHTAVGIDGLAFKAPVIDAILSDSAAGALIYEFTEKGMSVIINDNDGKITVKAGRGGKSEEAVLPKEAEKRIASIAQGASTWGGVLKDNGELVCDLKSPQPGPNYYTNMLLGNRVGFDRPLQSTPKSVTDRFGRGSFRSHADTQVLATKWDYCPEENGFPLNRQFYLVENGRVIFYSADPNSNVKSAHCTFSQNSTEIEYETECGLYIKRTIFILPQEGGMPLAVETQKITVENRGSAARSLRLVTAGMFGTNEGDALKTDVIYSTVICQSQVLYNEDGSIAAVGYDYNPVWEKSNERFYTLMLHGKGGVSFPDQFCFNVNEFLGSGSLEHPQGAAKLPCRHTRRGPGFFALSVPFAAEVGETVEADGFVGLVSTVVGDGKPVTPEQYKNEISLLIDKYSKQGAADAALAKVKSFAAQYASFIKLYAGDKGFESYVNANLPYQVMYQTFVSRSFDQTQKGFREIGFREIQDIFASMYYFMGMGRADFVKALLREWISNVHKMGYANHNFYWKGKEPGFYSDDQLWLLQALDRYCSFTGDTAFLKENCPMADGGERSVYDTIKAIITYSARISVGGHGLPIMDRTDWNDCLKVDPDYLTGPDKQKAYAAQIAEGGKYGDPFKNVYSESVMNGFLLKCAVDAAHRLALMLDDSAYAAELDTLSGELLGRLQEHCWKGDFFARVLFNRLEKPQLTYLGAGGDGLEVEMGAHGTYFLNSFSWSLLAQAANEEQIGVMLDTIDTNLKTPFGYRLCSTVNYPLIAPRIDASLYFPGDRENGAVFKHANMMAAAAMMKGADTVKDRALAARLMNTAYWIVDAVLPYKTLGSPFETAGNPRFCTQYNNSETGENIGPTLSGTSTWMLLTLMSGFGLNFKDGGLELRPLLREADISEHLSLNVGDAVYDIKAAKPEGFRRAAEGFELKFDGKVFDGVIPLKNDGEKHSIEMKLL